MNEFSMHDATLEGDLCRVMQLIEAGVSVDSPYGRGHTHKGRTPLHLAALYGQYKVAALLIDSKCNINLKDLHGCTTVMLAAGCGRKDIVDLLLHHGAQVNCADDEGWTLLHMASCKPGGADIVRLILENGEADLNAVDKYGETPLIWAARGGQMEVAAHLIRAGADINRSDAFQKTAMHWAAYGGHTGVIQILLEKEGLDLNPQDHTGDTPLRVACRINGREVIKQLLDAGADTNVKNNLGETALSEVIRRSTLTIEEIYLFVEKGAFLENCDYECISRNPFLKENILKDVKFCTQSVVNKFHHQSLPALNSITNFARKLPNADNFKLGARHRDEVENLVKWEIQRNTFCNVVKVHPIALSALCVRSLITCQSGKK